ncbi:HAMP domain-containing histidine kinase (plasmid) [Embleya sp. NBC_00888]|uniref:sensor histidine kinase n=1 Tax=Embleya sp. NBC_00888 TaxID=2975960 RepID=UPI0038675AAD|nr:HAMP domain-containing histidine kinase [Embleya sp. NBC_00888]
MAEDFDVARALALVMRLARYGTAQRVQGLEITRLPANAVMGDTRPAAPDGTDELHRLADTFDTMLDRPEKAFDSQRRFVANASHELRTPLAVQRAGLQVGLADPLPEGLAEVREDLLTANRDAEKLIAALLLLARSDCGLHDTEPVDLRDLARQAAAELAAPADEKDVAVTVTGSPIDIDGDPVLLRHLLTNLIGNAIRYNHAGGRVDVALERRTLTVTNTGSEIPADRVNSSSRSDALPTNVVDRSVGTVEVVRWTCWRSGRPRPRMGRLPWASSCKAGSHGRGTSAAVDEWSAHSSDLPRAVQALASWP